MNIALINLSHMTRGVQTNTVPLGIGFIARYLENSLPHECDVKIFKDPARFLDTVRKWKPDVLGIGQYPWNSELNLYMAGLVKKDNPECLVAAGGPNLYTTSDERCAYLKKHDSIDVCVDCDGEIPFTDIVRRFIKGEKKESIRSAPAIGSYSINASTGKLVESKGPAPRLKSLDIFGPMYASGFFEELLNQGFHPFLQTQRGCPFSCSYCTAGAKYHSKMVFQSKEIFKKDMEYLGKRFSGEHNIVLYLANSNFGLFDQDLAITRIIRQTQDKYDWPREVYVPSGKNKDRVLELISILRYKYAPSLSLQTLTPKVLKNIKRTNLPFNEFVDFQKKITRMTDKSTTTELILNLPEETKESFTDTVSRVLNSGVQDIAIWTLMALRGTDIASNESARRYGHVIRHRLVPRCFSEINNTKILESEDVVVATDSMPFEDYMDLRGLALIITIFAGSIEMFPVRKFLMEHDVKIADWVFEIKDGVSGFPELNRLYNAFLEETKKELFGSEKELRDFFNKEENYRLLSEGKLGDNLLRKYRAMALSRHYKGYSSLVFSAAKKKLLKKIDKKLADAVMNDLTVFVNTRDIGHVFIQGYGEVPLKNIKLQYDIPRWLTEGASDKRLEDYRGEFSYSVVVTDYLRNRLKNYKKMYRDPELSLHIIYRESFIKDFWPRWIPRGHKVRSLK